MGSYGMCYATNMMLLLCYEKPVTVFTDKEREVPRSSLKNAFFVVGDNEVQLCVVWRFLICERGRPFKRKSYVLILCYAYNHIIR